MILFNDWKITCEGGLLAMQSDHLSRELRVRGDLPAGWNWAALVRCGELFDIIPLKAGADGGAAAVLTARQLSRGGSYTLQLRGTKGETVRHTNTVQVYVGSSLSGDEHWPEIPSEFSEFERRVMDAVERAESAGFPYKIGLGLKATEDRTLMVDSAENFDGDNDRPASAALVKTQLGNIEAFLATI